jgi:hypothetical protein
MLLSDCVGMLVLAYPLEDCYPDTYQEDVPGDDNHRTVPSLGVGGLNMSALGEVCGNSGRSVIG